MPHISHNPDSPQVRMKVIDLIWLDSVLDDLRHAYRHGVTRRDKVLLALSVILTIIMLSL